MFSFIMPTMWRSDFTKKLLEDLQESEYVSEIILIDNDPSNKNIDISKFNKIVYLPQEFNIFVNPAWNLGVSVAKNDLIAISNDDINFNVDVYLSTVLKYQDILGVFGINYRNSYTSKYSDLIHLNADILKKGAIVGNGFGMLMFMRKQNWKNIPEGLKIYFGDNWIIGTHPNSSYVIEPTGYKIVTKPHTTSKSKELREILDKDIKYWNNLISVYKNF